MTPEAISLVPSPSPMMLPGLSHPLHPSEHSVSPKPTPPGSHLLKVVPLFRGPQGQTPGYLLTPPPHSQSLPGPQLSSVTLSVPRVLAQDSSAPMWTPQPPPRPPGPQSAPTQPQRVAPRTDLAPLHRAPSPSTPQLALGGTVGLGLARTHHHLSSPPRITTGLMASLSVLGLRVISNSGKAPPLLYPPFPSPPLPLALWRAPLSLLELAPPGPLTFLWPLEHPKEPLEPVKAPPQGVIVSSCVFLPT